MIGKIGVYKKADCFELPKEENPAMEYDELSVSPDRIFQIIKTVLEANVPEFRV